MTNLLLVPLLSHIGVFLTPFALPTLWDSLLLSCLLCSVWDTGLLPSTALRMVPSLAPPSGFRTERVLEGKAEEKGLRPHLLLLNRPFQHDLPFDMKIFPVLILK